MDMKPDATAELAAFASGLRYDDLPAPVVLAVKKLFIDWLGSALAGGPSRQARTIARFADTMGSERGVCSDFATGRKRAAYFAAMINASASHVVEQDDLHNSSVLHPATVVFSPLVAAAEEGDFTGKQVIAAAVAGYEAGIRVGEYLGLGHYVHFHTTATAGTLAAAAAVANLIGLDPERTGHAFGTAGTTAAGLWEFLATAADSKQIHVAHAASAGLMAAYLSRDGFLGAKRIFDGVHGMGVAMSGNCDPSRLSDGLGSRWATAETSYKWHASCRHTHPAADALLSVIAENGLSASEIERITAHVHQAAIDVLGPVTAPTTVHQAKFSMGTVLGLIAVHGKAGLEEFDDYALTDPDVLRFLGCVTMEHDPDIEAAYPKNWIGRVEVVTRDGRRFEGRVVEPKGDPGNPLTQQEIVDKARALARYGGGVAPETIDRWIENILHLDDRPQFAGVFARE